MVRSNGARGTETDDGAWFEPKTYGYGAGPPIAWQGWALILAFFVLLGLSAWLVLPHSILAFIAIAIGATAALILISAMKTRGGWRWRSGKDS